MNKQISRIVAMGIGLSVISGSIIPAYATESINTSVIKNVQTLANEDNILTVEEAINAAISNSDTLALKSKEIKLAKDKLDIQDDIDDFKDEDHDFPYDKLELLLNQTKENRDFMEDQIAEDIRGKFNDLVSAEMTIEKLKKDIDIKNREIETKLLKHNLGLATSIEIDAAKLELQNLKVSLTNKENSLKDNKDYLGLLTNLDLSKYTLDRSVDYTPFRIEGSIDSYMSARVDEYMHYNEELITLTKDYLKDNKVKEPSSPSKKAPDKNDYYDTVTNDDGTVSNVFDEEAYKQAVSDYKDDCTAYLTGMNTYASYLSSKYELNSSEVSISEGKKTLKKGLIDSYTALLNLEDNINVLKSQMELTNRKLEITRTQYNVGLATKLDYDTAVVASQEIEISLRSLIDNYNKLKTSIQKPWVLSSGSSSK